MQMSQFWRPSAWADYLHAYNTFDRMLLEPGVLYTPGHVLIDPHRLCFTSVMIFSVGFGSGNGIWMCILSIVGWFCMMGTTISSRVLAALKRNTTVKKPDVSTNMPTLIHHLRQLVAASGIIQEHTLRGSTQPAKITGDHISSSIALMHASDSYHQVLKNLIVRLAAALHACCQKYSVDISTLQNLPAEPDILLSGREAWNSLIDDMEKCLETFPYV